MSYQTLIECMIDGGYSEDTACRYADSIFGEAVLADDYCLQEEQEANSFGAW